jgi:hypothetical protein
MKGSLQAIIDMGDQSHNGMIWALQTIWAAITSDYLKNQEWVAWSEQVLLNSPAPQAWMVDLYESKTPEDARNVASEVWKMIDKGDNTVETLDEKGLILGFYYLRYKSGELSIGELLHLAGDFADAANYDNPECEAFYQFLNQYEQRPGAEVYDADKFNSGVAALFATHAQQARAMYDALILAH